MVTRNLRHFTPTGVAIINPSLLGARVRHCSSSAAEHEPRRCSNPAPRLPRLGSHESGAGMNSSRLVAKQVGVSGQISLGKEYAGRTVLIDSSEPGVWVIKTAQTIPDSELWLHQPEASARLDRALLAITEPPCAADLNALEQHLSGT